MEEEDPKKKDLDFRVQSTVGRHGKQKFQGEDTVSQMPLSAVQLLICPSVMKREKTASNFFF